MADTSYKLINEEILTDIADAIREKSEVSTTYYPHEMPDAIRDIDTGEDLNLTVATVTSTEASQTVTPTQGYNGFSRVNVNPIPSQYKKLTTTTTATADNILNGKTVYNNNGQLVTGSMANNGSTSGTISTKEGTVTIPSGYTSGGTVSINSSEKAKIVDSNIKSGVTILGVSGKSSVVDTANSNAVAENILANKTAFVNGTKVTGNMPNNGATGGTISTKAGTVTIPAGHTTGGTVSISTTEQEKIVAGNIKEGVTILGVTGTASGGSTPVLQEKTATPDTTTQQIRPDDNYDGLSKVTVNPIPSQYKPLTTTTTATADNILNTKTAYNSNGQLMTGSMANNGSTGGTINTKTGTVTIPEGYTSGGNVSISSAEQAKIIADNIKQGVTILGVTGTASGSTPVLQTKTVKSTTDEDKTYTPETGYDGFSSVTVEKFNLQEKTINPGTSDKTVTPSSGYDGFSQVTVRGVPLQTEKTTTLIQPTEVISPDTGYTAMMSVEVTAPLETLQVAATRAHQTKTPTSPNIGFSQVIVAPLNSQENKTVTPTKLSQYVTADTGYDTLDMVTVNGDSNLEPENIVSGITIFGVTGTATGGTPTLQTKTVTPSSSLQTVRADNGYDGLEQVNVNGDTDLVSSNIKKDVEIFGVTGTYEPNLQSNKNVTPTTSQQIIEPDSDYDGLERVTVSAMNLGSLQLTMADAGDSIYASDEGYDGFNEVFLHSPSLETVTVTPTAALQTITPSSGYDAIEEVTVFGDSNLVASNIVNGVTIFGVTGTASSGTPTLQSKTATPSDTPQTITADTGYDGLSSVTVSGDANLTASNIVSGTTIFGVTGTYTPNLQSKTVTLSSTQQTITADTAQGYDGLSSVIVPAIPAVNLQSKTVTLSKTLSSPQVVTADSGYDGLSQVTVPSTRLYQATVNLTEAGTTYITPPDNYFGLSQAIVTPSLQVKSNIVPTDYTQIITPDSGYLGLRQISVSGDANLVPSNIVSGVTIFGVTGTASGSAPNLQSKTVTLDSAQQTITADSGYDGLSSVIVPNSSLQNKTVTLTSSQQVITADNGYYGLGQVTVPAESGGGGDEISPKFYSSTSGTNGTVTFTAPDSSNTKFYGLSGIKKIILNGATMVWPYAFVSWTATELEVVAPDLVDANVRNPGVPTNAFASAQTCYNNVTKVTIGKAGSSNTITIGATAFQYSQIKNIYLPGDTVVNLSNTNAFSGLMYYNVTVHVPSSLLSDYLEDTNWAAANGTSITIAGDL